MADPTLPTVIESLRQAINSGDTEAFLAFFPDDGAVEDWGRRFSGHAAIRGWSDKELIGAKGTLTIAKVLSASPQTVEVVADWKSSFFSGASRFTFTLDGGKVREMRISEG
ncbi:nuclear transport factor 2 family protein [Paradevosia shaoguanensis]|uniref:Nuclear transport factor 2 family protein n=1 Tax=Paradevosia shaoguanensis TaxID=1335043 RepID=A0AA41UIL6_9HYPH|nr:nuclear transport factor 2 family protein [Paradevosia shaoguanensis]MCF1744978.1 nuclear transport factor 2 family protein [Paradevosia shaoguanensis]MCI0129461.1 nuclear transport factor 2 family protein [Paradevosia shaoguanensis]